MSDLAARAAVLAGNELVDVKPLSGGSLSQVTRLRLADGRTLVAKQGATAPVEAEMLRAIVATGARAPAVIGVAGDLLVMEAVAADSTLGGRAWSNLADTLAHLHTPTRELYGWPADHAFGAVAIPNARSDNWAEFWAERRLRCQRPHVDAALARRLDRLADRCGELLPAQPSSALLHGDLWGGNVLVGHDGAVTLIDPACYHGHREVDVAMLTLFDRPPSTFFDALGLDAGWRERLPIYRLWPLLVHLRLFGAGYRSQVDDTLDRLGV